MAVLYLEKSQTCMPVSITISEKRERRRIYAGSLKVRLLFMLILLTAGVFSIGLRNDFQRGWDDQWQVLDNPFVSEPSWDYITYHFTHFFHGQYSPVNTMFYMAVYAVAGYSPAAFHALSLAIHMINTLLVFFLAVRFLSTAPQFAGARALWYAGLVSLVFAIHPLQVEAVSWISASKVLLFSFFTFIALLIYMRYIKTKQYALLVWVMVCYLLAFGSKEQAVILPLTLITLDYLFGRLKDISLSWRSWLQPVVIEKLPFLLVALGMWYFSSRNGLGHLQDVNAYPFGQRLVFGAHSLVVYIFRFLAPVKMYYFYFYPMVQGEPLPAMYWSYPVLLLIIIWFGVEQYRKGNRLTVFGLLFFLVNLLLVIHLLPMPRKMITADRYMYMSITGLAIAAVPFVERSFQWFAERKKIWLPGLMMALWLAATGGYSVYRTTQWKDSPTIKSNINELIEKRKAAGEKGLENPVKGEMRNE